MIWQNQTDVASAVEVPHLTGRQWRRFGLRTFLVMVTLLCVAIGTLATKARQQRRLVAAIDRVGGEVRYDWQPDPAEQLDRLQRQRRLQAMRAAGAAPMHADHPKGPAWLRGMVGDEYFQHVEEITLRSPRWSRLKGGKNGFLQQVANASNVETLIVLHSDFNDDDLRLICHMKGLRRLTINGADISDEGLPLLYGMKNLESLIVVGPRLTFEAVVELSTQLPECRVCGPIEGITLVEGEVQGNLSVFDTLW
ncbi:hypothetical protein NG895_17415 [Aeoliella sp. ICT_H6.2]|uniref:Uncharacterized protein n=1 Tax=Aeoliella straminimaris TaxID=2954799 RepID=A0A9X2FG13_9BACT|nr:hypothetical protein [Aeoliella straminimaris]MCO6045679.1 hypothetical protein [Aeoliella straminimaris]